MDLPWYLDRFCYENCSPYAGAIKNYSPGSLIFLIFLSKLSQPRDTYVHSSLFGPFFLLQVPLLINVELPYLPITFNIKIPTSKFYSEVGIFRNFQGYPLFIMKYVSLQNPLLVLMVLTAKHLLNSPIRFWRIHNYEYPDFYPPGYTDNSTKCPTVN